MSTPLSFTSATPFHAGFVPQKFRAYTEHQIDQIAPLEHLNEEQRFSMRVVASVLPFRVNQYVIDELIDWDNVPEDPMFQLTFPQAGMLSPSAFSRMASLLKSRANAREIKDLAGELRQELNPHPAEQQTLNIPNLDGNAVHGMQHKYKETVLFFPSQGQICHAFCTFCFRWAQFVGDKALRFATSEADGLKRYLKQHPEVSDVLITGGDPLVMKTTNLKTYLEALLDPDLEHVTSIRIGTKALSYWPYRFVTDDDADDLLRLFETLAERGKHLALMAHINHWRELEPPIVAEAIRRLRDTGGSIRAQSPVLGHINDDAEAWSRLWCDEVGHGIYPYYMFVERDTGAKGYFEIPLVRAWQVYRDAIRTVSGLARTARGPSMSTGPGKIEIQGVTEVQGEKVFVLRFIQGRNPGWVQRPFFARYSETATWLSELKPAFGEQRFFFESEYEDMLGSGVN